MQAGILLLLLLPGQNQFSFTQLCSGSHPCQTQLQTQNEGNSNRLKGDNNDFIFPIYQIPVTLLTSSLLLASSAQDVPSVPGLQAWRQAQSRVLEAERRLTGSEAATDLVTPGSRVPGIDQWRAHQTAALQAERQLQAGEAITERIEVTKTVSSAKEKSPSPITPGKKAAGLNELRSLLQTSIKKFLSKTKERKEVKIDSNKSSSIFSLLSNYKKSNKKAKSQTSYLDQLIKSYKSDSSERDNLVRDFDFLNETPRSRGSLSSLEFFDDPYVSRSRSLYQEDIDEALIESKLLDRELKKMLRKLQFDY